MDEIDRFGSFIDFEIPQFDRSIIATAGQQSRLSRIPVNTVHIVLVRIVDLDHYFIVDLLIRVLTEHAQRIVSTCRRNAIIHVRPTHIVDGTRVMFGQCAYACPLSVHTMPHSHGSVVRNGNQLVTIPIEIDCPDGRFVSGQRFKAHPIVSIFSIQFDCVVVATAGQHRFGRMPSNTFDILAVIGDHTGTFKLVLTNTFPNPDSLVATAGGQKFVIRRKADRFHLIFVPFQIDRTTPILSTIIAFPNAGGRIKTATGN